MLNSLKIVCVLKLFAPLKILCLKNASLPAFDTFVMIKSITQSINMPKICENLQPSWSGQKIHIWEDNY